MSRAARVLLGLLLVGCVPGRVGAALLSVSLRTDFVPAEEFATVRVVMTTIDGSRVSEDDLAADPALAYIDGVAILENGAASGPYLLEVTLLGRQGATVARRRVAVQLGAAQQAVTVVITRDSSGCDESACAEGETCGPSGCVDVHCTPETPETCPPTACTTAADCPARAACASAACASGACLYGARDGACGAGEWCDADDGCLPRTSPVGDVGRECAADEECTSGVCVATGGASACTSACMTGSDCMSGWSCGPAEGATGDVCLCTVTGPEVCSGADEDCDAYVDEDAVCAADVGTPCADGDACASGVCAETGGGAGACTMACRGTGDCLAGWTCGSVDGVPGEVCLCTASVETCNGADDDCDGAPDDGGVCGTTGTDCTMEICNLADDDCDSFCDDGASCRRPVHRAFNPTTSQHFYSASLIEITSQSALMFESQDYFQVYLVPHAGLVPLHRCFWAGEGSHFLSRSADCEGATVDGMVGFISPIPSCSSVPLFEVRSPVHRADAVYTRSGPERQDLLADGWRDFGVIGHVWPSEWRCTTPRAEDCANGLDDDCDGRTDCEDASECCSSGHCSGIRAAGAYRIRCCERAWVNIARSENHCGGCNGICQDGHFCNPDGAGSGHCGCDATNPFCARGQSCVEQNTPRDGTLAYRCTCLADDQCANTFTCRGLGDGDNVHNVCHPTL